MKANNTILPAKALADLAHNQHEVINVYSHPFTYWDGETTTEYVFIVRVKDGRLMLLSCTDVVTIPSTVFTPDDRRVYFPADELDKLVKRAKMLTDTTDETPDNNTPSTSDTMNTETKTMNEVATVEFSELSHAAQCTDIYLHNPAEIYERYTVPAIAECVKCMSTKSPAMLELVKKALQAATRLVIKHDRITPTADDIRTVFNNYLGYIIDCAEFEIKNA